MSLSVVLELQTLYTFHKELQTFLYNKLKDGINMDSGLVQDVVLLLENSKNFTVRILVFPFREREI